MQYNILTEKWIQVLGSEGITFASPLGINDTHTRIVGPPMEVFSAYRFLIGLQLSGFPDNPNICDSQAPYLQAPAPQEKKVVKKTIGYLTPDTPVGSNSMHFRHSRDDRKFLCPACITRALVCLPAFCTVGGQGLSPSFNGNPPVYFLPLGRNIKETVALTANKFGRETIEHTESYGEVKTLSFPQALAFRPRRVHIFWQDVSRSCSRCGDVSFGASEMIFTPGDKYVGNSYRDPHVMYGGKKVNPLRARTDWEQFTDWDSFTPELWNRKDAQKPMPADRYLVVGCVTSKAKFEDVFMMEFTP